MRPGCSQALLESHCRITRFDNGGTLALPEDPLQFHFLHARKMAEKRQGQAVDRIRRVALERMGHVKVGMITFMLLPVCVPVVMASMLFRQQGLDCRGAWLAASTFGKCQQVTGITQFADCFSEGCPLLFR